MSAPGTSNPEPHRLTTEEYRLVGQLLALSVSPPWTGLVRTVMTATGPGQGAKAAANLFRLLPVEEWERLEALFDRLRPPGGWRRV